MSNLPPGIRKHHGGYQLRWYSPDGKRQAEQFDRLSDAKRRQQEIAVDKRRGDYIDPRNSRRKFGEWATTYVEGKQVRSASKARDESLLRVHLLPTFERTPLGRIDAEAVQEWVNALSKKEVGSGEHRKLMSPRTVRECYRLFSEIMTRAARRKLIAESPCVEIDLPLVRRAERAWLSAVQVESLAAEVAEHHRPLIYFAAYTGARWEEVAALKWENVDLERRTARIAATVERVGGTYRYTEDMKTEASARTIVLPEFLTKILRDHRKATPPSFFVFASSEGQMLRYDNFRARVWNPAVKRAGLFGLTFHALRHTCAALLIDRGVNPLEIMRRLGHADIKVTLNTYGHLYASSDERLTDALETTFHEANGDQVGTTEPSNVVPMQADQGK